METSRTQPITANHSQSQPITANPNQTLAFFFLFVFVLIVTLINHAKRDAKLAEETLHWPSAASQHHLLVEEGALPPGIHLKEMGIIIGHTASKEVTPWSATRLTGEPAS